MRVEFNISRKGSGGVDNFSNALEAVVRNVGAGTKMGTIEAAVDIMTESLRQVPYDTGALYSSAYLGISKRHDVKNYKYGAILGYGSSSDASTVISKDTGQPAKKEYNKFGRKDYKTGKFTGPGQYTGFAHYNKDYKLIRGSEGQLLMQKARPYHRRQANLKGGFGDNLGLGGIDWLMFPSNPVNPRHGFRASVYATRVHEDMSIPHNNGNAKFLENPIREWASGRFSRTVATYWRIAVEEFEGYGQYYTFGKTGAERGKAISHYKVSKFKDFKMQQLARTTISRKK